MEAKVAVSQLYLSQGFPLAGEISAANSGNLYRSS